MWAWPLEGVGVPADPAAEGELLSGGRMLDVERTLLALHGHALRADGALRQVRLGDVRHPLEVVVTGVAEMGRTCAHHNYFSPGHFY